MNFGILFLNKPLYGQESFKISKEEEKNPETSQHLSNSPNDDSQCIEVFFGFKINMHFFINAFII